MRHNKKLYYTLAIVAKGSKTFTILPRVDIIWNQETFETSKLKFNASNNPSFVLWHTTVYLVILEFMSH